MQSPIKKSIRLRTKSDRMPMILILSINEKVSKWACIIFANKSALSLGRRVFP